MQRRRSFFGSSHKTYADEGVVERPLRRAATIHDIDRFPWPTPDDYGTPEEVRREVWERIRVLGAGGGYIVSPDHAVLDDVPAANVVALYDAAGSLAGV